MYCTHCGSWNENREATSCYHCGQPIAPAPPSSPLTISNHLWAAIAVTFCCCLPLGVPAIVYGALVSSKVEAGDIQGALDCSQKAKLWAWVGFGVGLAVYLLSALGLMGAVASR